MKITPRLQNEFDILGFSQREIEVASLGLQFLSNKEIANILNISEKTVKYHFTRIFKILQFTHDKRTRFYIYFYQRLFPEHFLKSELSFGKSNNIIFK